MFNFKSIRMKIMLGFSLVILLVIALGVTSTLSINNMNSHTRDIINEELPLLVASEKIALNTSQRLAQARAYVLYGDKDYKDEFMRYTEEGADLQDKILELYPTEEMKQLIFRTIEWREIIINDVFYEYDKGNR